MKVSSIQNTLLLVTSAASHASISSIACITHITQAFILSPPPLQLSPTFHHFQQQQHVQQLHFQRHPFHLSSSPDSAAEGYSFQSNSSEPKTFREGEVMGLRLMQNGRYQDAINAFNLAMTLPGSRPDILRTANVPGPSPVGGAKGGTEGRSVRTLDEFEYQAAHYNIACAYACLGEVGESVANLKKAFDYGFDNFATVRADPDLSNVQSTKEFERLMDEYDPQKFNPFGVFGGKN